MCENIPIHLEDLPSELLVTIFQEVAKTDLLNLRLTCRRFCSIISTFWDTIVFSRRVAFLVTNQQHNYMQRRSDRIISPFNKHRISHNWQSGRYEEKNIFLSKRFIHSFHMEKDIIWLGKGYFIKAFKRHRHKINLHRPLHNLSGFNSSEICKFVVRDDLVLLGNGNTLRLYSIQDKKYLFDRNLDQVKINCVDMASNLIAVGSRNNELYLYENSYQSSPIFRSKAVYEDRIWSVALHGSRLAMGTAANNSLTSLIIYDTEMNKTLLKLDTNERGAGILHLKWETDSILWSAGYDSLVRKWDIRSGECVQTFKDPWMDKIYCFDYDYVNTIISGCGSHGRVVLWDTRKDRYVQMYYMQSCTKYPSPVYSLAFDAEHLYTATEVHINILDFSVFRGTAQEYSDIFKFQIII